MQTNLPSDLCAYYVLNQMWIHYLKASKQIMLWTQWGPPFCFQGYQFVTRPTAAEWVLTDIIYICSWVVVCMCTESTQSRRSTLHTDITTNGIRKCHWTCWVLYLYNETVNSVQFNSLFQQTSQISCENHIFFSLRLLQCKYHLSPHI